jgi:hypothetical protein
LTSLRGVFGLTGVLWEMTVEASSEGCFGDGVLEGMAGALVGVVCLGGMLG